MKKLIIAIAAVSAALLFVSCNKGGGAPFAPAEGEGSYTFMVYSYTGEGMDVYSAMYALQSIYEGSSGKVKMTYQHKSSPDIRTAGGCPELEGVFRLDLDDFSAWKGNASLPHDLNGENASFEQFYDVVKDKAIAVGDSTYRVATAEALADFIKWSRQRHPADNYVLLFVGHGDGWSPSSDGLYDSTKAVIFETENGTTRNLSLGEVLSGVKKGMDGRKLNTLYLNNCLLASLENYSGYMEIADYVFGAVETTTGIGLNFGKYLSTLKSVSEGQADFKTAMKGIVDYLVGEEWWSSPEYEDGEKTWGDINFTDLSRFGAVLDAVKAWADLLDANWAAQEGVLSLAAMSTMTSQAYGDMSIVCDDDMVPLVSGILGGMPDGNRLNGYHLKSIIKYVESAEDSDISDEDAYNILTMCFRITLYSQCSYNYILADMMNWTVTLLEGLLDDPDEGEDAKKLLAEVKKAREQYYLALKDAAYIGCTHPDADDDAYDYSSYSVLLSL